MRGRRRSRSWPPIPPSGATATTLSSLRPVAERRQTCRRPRARGSGSRQVRAAPRRSGSARSRRSAAAASIPSGGAVTSTPREAMTASTARSPMGAARAVPRAWTAAPTSRCSGRSTSGGRTRIETSKSTASPTAPVSIRLARASKTRSPVARFSTLPTIVACTTTARPPPRANPSAATREGCASATWDAAAAAAAIRSTTTTRACPRRPRRLRAARPRAAIATREAGTRPTGSPLLCRRPTEQGSHQRGRPCAERDRSEPQVRRPLSPHDHTVTRSRRVSSILSPIPGTARRSSTLVNRPLASRHR